MLPAEDRGEYLYEIDADADPDVWLRIAQTFLLANVAPVRAILTQGSPARVRLAIAMQGIGEPIAELIRRKLLQLTCVHEVTLNEHLK